MNEKGKPMVLKTLQTSAILGAFLMACNQATDGTGGSGTKEDFQREDYVVFEGDMLIPKSEFEAFKAGIGRGPEIPEGLENPAYGPDGKPFPLRKAAQRQLGTVVSGSRIADVKILLSGVPSEWVPYIDNAIAAYNQLSNSTAIRMRKVTSGADITIRVNTSVTNGACGEGFAPSGGAPGTTVTLYTNNDHLRRNRSLWTPLIIHELGHTIGLGHTNENGPHIPTTPSAQTASIMQAGTCASPAMGLTAYDLKALVYFYPPAGTRPWMRWDDYANWDFTYSTTLDYPAVAEEGNPLYIINVGMILTSSGTGRIPLYKYNHPGITDHFYTTNWNEGQTAVNSGYVYQGITGYLSTTQAPDSYPLYRYYSSANNSHFYGTGAGPSGYVQEGGILGYIRASVW